jgi:hypothetical protein
MTEKLITLDCIDILPDPERLLGALVASVNDLGGHLSSPECVATDQLQLAVDDVLHFAGELIPCLETAVSMIQAIGSIRPGVAVRIGIGSVLLPGKRNASGVDILSHVDRLSVISGELSLMVAALTKADNAEPERKREELANVVSQTWRIPGLHSDTKEISR